MSKVVIIGAGPAGIFCGLRLSEVLSGEDITIIERVNPLINVTAHYFLTASA